MTWRTLLKKLNDDLEYADPLYEQTEAGEALQELMIAVENSQGVWLEPSIQGGMGGIWIYRSDNDDCVASEIDYQNFNNDVISIALGVTSANEFKQAYDRYLKDVIVNNPPDDDDDHADVNEFVASIDASGHCDVPEGAQAVPKDAFEGCKRLTSITIPDSVTSIGSEAFSGCSGLTSITLPDSVTSIGEYAFCNCEGLTSIAIPDFITSICDGVFSGCAGLTSTVIPDSVTSIGDNAFNGCEGLTSITIPDSVTSIGNWAFYYCEGLTSITIPDFVTSIGAWAFDHCPKLTIYTSSGSYVEQYAHEYNIPVVTDSSEADTNELITL